MLAEELVNRLGSGVVILGGTGGGKVSFAVKVSKDLVARGFKAGDIVKEAARVAGGGGGGRPDFAQAGGKDPAKLATPWTPPSAWCCNWARSEGPHPEALTRLVPRHPLPKQGEG